MGRTHLGKQWSTPLGVSLIACPKTIRSWGRWDNQWINPSMALLGNGKMFGVWPSWRKWVIWGSFLGVLYCTHSFLPLVHSFSPSPLSTFLGHRFLSLWCSVQMYEAKWPWKEVSEIIKQNLSPSSCFSQVPCHSYAKVVTMSLCLSEPRKSSPNQQPVLTSSRWCLLLPVAASPAALALLEPRKKCKGVRKV